MKQMGASELKVAIVCDWLVGGGAERVVLELHKLFPEAPIYTSYCSRQWRQRLAEAEVITGYLQHWPFSKLRKLVGLLRSLWFSGLNFDKYDLVISCSGAEAKGIKVNKPTTHIGYCLAPTHYYWGRYEQYLENPGLGWFNPVARVGLKLLVGPLRRLDFRAAQRADQLIAISTYTQQQIKKYYGRDSAVIHPPVDIERFTPANRSNEQRQAYVTAGRQTPYKRFDLAVEAANLTGLPLLVIGQGPDNRRLRKLAQRSVTFLNEVSDEQMPEYFGSAKGFIFPGIDDFGIVAIEALAAGTPVLAYKAGGALDYIDHQSGRFFDRADPESLANAWEKFGAANFNHQQVAQKARFFAADNFRKKLMQYINKGVK